MRTGNIYIAFPAGKSQHQPWVILARPCSQRGETTALRGIQSIVPSVPLPVSLPPEGELFVQRAGGEETWEAQQGVFALPGLVVSAR